jgi:uncharacterized Zn finger protein (UPF0148 family)
MDKTDILPNRCPKCGAKLTSYDVSCPDCGEDVGSCGEYLGAASGTASDTRIKCQACFNDNPLGALFCSVCGASLKYANSHTQNRTPLDYGRTSREFSKIHPNDSPSVWMFIVGFLFPVIGIILWALQHKTWPLRSNSGVMGAAIALGLGLLFAVLTSLLGQYK